MRKLFVLFLLVALVPFTVGCNGLWDFDDDDDTVVAPATTTLTSKVILPATAVTTGANFRAAFAYDSLTMTVAGIPYTATGVVDNGDGNVTVTFTAKVAEATAKAVTGDVPVSISLGGTEIVKTTVPVGTAVATAINVTITNDPIAAAGTFKPVLGATTFTTSTSTTPQTATPTGTVINTATIPAPIAIASVVSENKTLTTANDANTVTLTNLKPTFTVTLGTAVTNGGTASWIVEVTNVGSGIKFTLDSSNTADAALFKVTGTSSTVVTIEVIGGTGKNLKAGQTYSVKLKSSNLKTSAGAALDTTGTYYFKS